MFYHLTNGAKIPACISYTESAFRDDTVVNLPAGREYNYLTFGGSGRIRTHGPVTAISFQDCRLRPLSHASKLTKQLRIVLRIHDQTNIDSVGVMWVYD